METLSNYLPDKVLSEYFSAKKNKEILPLWSQKYNIDHMSPSQLNQKDGVWSFKYLFCDERDRREFEINSKMQAGNAVGKAGILLHGDIEWVGDKHVIHKPYPKIDDTILDKVYEQAISYYMEYKPVDDMDRQQFQNNKENLIETIKTFFKAFNEIGLKKQVHCERTIAVKLKSCVLPVIGRIDFEDDNYFLELKTKWGRKAPKAKKDGTTSFYNVKINDKPDPAHLLQVAIYWLATKKKPHLLYITKEDYKIFTPENCEELQPERLNFYINQAQIVAYRRERLMARHNGEHSYFADLDPDFDHPYAWNIGSQYKNKAMQLWGFTK
jgi:hypothetical protein